MQAHVAIEELDAVLNSAPVTLPALDADIGIDDRLELAAETDERGPLETIKGLLEGLRVRHQGDDVTTSVLAAIEHYHLPMLLEGGVE